MSLCSDEKSELTFGWYDDTRYKNTLYWHPVINKYFWSLKLDDIMVSLKFNNYF